jgi:mannose-1-phosphate guanylyltransferase
MDHHYVVIMAGGSGTRLWPLSRTEHPKQFQKLINEQKTLLQETFDRVRPIVPKHDHIFVSTTRQYADLVKQQLPQISEDNIIIEPCGRDTAPAMALVAHMIYRTDPDAIITTTPSDHAIKNPENYTSTVHTAFSVIHDHPKRFGLIGITPTEPSTELGYIQMGNAIDDKYNKQVFEARAFKEKPDAKTAEEYLAHWSYLWNAAYFVFKADTFLAMVKKHTPHIHTALKNIDKTTDPDVIHEIYCTLPKEPIDTVLLEKLSARNRFVIPADLVWSDVGNWRTLHDFHRADDKMQNITRGSVIDINSSNCFVFSHKKTIATLGVRDIVIIETEDAILVTHRDNAHDVKKIIDDLKDKNMNDLL